MSGFYKFFFFVFFYSHLKRCNNSSLFLNYIICTLHFIFLYHFLVSLVVSVYVILVLQFYQIYFLNMRENYKVVIFLWRSEYYN